MSDTTALTHSPVRADASGALVPTDLDAVQRIAKMMSASGMMPKGMGSVAAISVAIMQGLEVGLKPMQSVQSIAVINGRPAIWGDAMLALVQASGQLDDISEDPIIDSKTGEVTGYRCTVKRAGRSSHTQQIFTREMAKRAGLLDKSGPWTQYPERMLQLRARAFALRDAFPDSLRGLGMAEEVRDTPRDVTPTIDAKPSGLDAMRDLAATVTTTVTEQTEDGGQVTYDQDTGEVLDTEPVQTADSPDTDQPAKEPTTYERIVALAAELGHGAADAACKSAGVDMGELHSASYSIQSKVLQRLSAAKAKEVE